MKLNILRDFIRKSCAFSIFKWAKKIFVIRERYIFNSYRFERSWVQINERSLQTGQILMHVRHGYDEPIECLQ